MNKNRGNNRGNKNEPFKQNRLITSTTTAIEPFHHEQYQSRKHDLFGPDEYYEDTPKDLINESSLTYSSDLKGLTASTNHNTGFKQKSPIAICRELDIYTCPTLSPDQFRCVWIFPWHIRERGGDASGSYVIFYNGKRLDLDVSYHVLVKQIQRTYEIMCRGWRMRNPLK